MESVPLPVEYHLLIHILAQLGSGPFNTTGMYVEDTFVSAKAMKCTENFTQNLNFSGKQSILLQVYTFSTFQCPENDLN